jgi:NAD(P)-dependent dehydrogenase (short-subunit alcohol dehydrogenase family)
MRDFEGRLAVLTGGGSGMGRALGRQLTAAGCHLAMCDVSPEELDETRALCAAGAPVGVRVTTFVADVSDEAQVLAFRDFVADAHASRHINLLFNNAGIGGGGSFVLDERSEWDATFAVCWGGVYACTRAFMPMLLASREGHIVNTSSVNGFWATLGPTLPNTAYSAAKFAVKGFTEALIVDLANNAPHVRASVVMPGHIGTSIVLNSGRYFGREPKELTEEQVAQARARIARQGLDIGGATDDDIRQGLQLMAETFRDGAPMTADEAAGVILDGVRNDEWRILVGADAEALDQMVRESPRDAYSVEFSDRLRAEGVFRFSA